MSDNVTILNGDAELAAGMMTVTAIFPGATADEARQAAQDWAAAETFWSLVAIRRVDTAVLHDGSVWYEHWMVQMDFSPRTPTLWEATA